MMTATWETISPLDLGWLLMESDKTPMHVGCVQVFELPSDADKNFVRDLYRQLIAQRECVPPFSLRMQHHGFALPHWESVSELDTECHVQHWALPPPGGPEELRVLVGRLHAEPLDMDLPLWEFHIIEGLREGTVAVYLKIHHAMVDGMAGMRLLQSMLSIEAQDNMVAPWSPRGAVAQLNIVSVPPKDGHKAGLLKRLRKVVDEVKHVPAVSGSLGSLAWAGMHRRHSDLQAPYTAPNCVLNDRVSQERGFAFARLSLDEMRHVAHHSGTSINDVLLAICAGSLRQVLNSDGVLPDNELLGGLPVSVRPQNDAHVGTAVSFIVAGLGTHLEDPRERLAHIHQSTKAAKTHLAGMSKSALTEYTLLMMAPYMAEILSGLAGRVTPAFNIIISNVPGPKESLYFGRAKLRAMYPLSIVTHGQALNVTALGYDGELMLGLTFCPRRLPSAAKLTQLMQAELEQLQRWATHTDVATA